MAAVTVEMMPVAASILRMRAPSPIYAFPCGSTATAVGPLSRAWTAGILSRKPVPPATVEIVPCEKALTDARRLMAINQR